MHLTDEEWKCLEWIATQESTSDPSCRDTVLGRLIEFGLVEQCQVTGLPLEHRGMTYRITRAGENLLMLYRS
ncbi:hypothetical protein [Thiohalobacter thiocyanaticus]|uniref:hypothetical protein n=1 Tax=Thiohalobacter thiocyanaticus TaxID=585455 RepID=UPI000F62D44C|nr:hypothetical protein [Thiohalobacter thiocyanaticus]